MLDPTSWPMQIVVGEGPTWDESSTFHTYSSLPQAVARSSEAASQARQPGSKGCSKELGKQFVAVELAH
jgi:hypothetical protein